MLRISLDAKARVKLGEFDRGGKSRVQTFANDHDFSKDSLVPFGILLPRLAELFLFFSASRFTSDFIVDCLEQWWEKVSDRFAHIQTLVINQDNGPENHSRIFPVPQKNRRICPEISSQHSFGILSALLQ